jgi:hypothetical protein
MNHSIHFHNRRLSALPKAGYRSHSEKMVGSGIGGIRTIYTASYTQQGSDIIQEAF